MICRRGRSGTRLVRRHGRSVVFATSISGGNYRVSAKIPGARGGCDGGTSVIFRGKVLPILTGETLVLSLSRECCLMRLVRIRFFLRSRSSLDTALAAVEGNVIFVDDHSAVVHVGHVSDADIGHGAVVIERTAAPLAADKADIPPWQKP